MLWPVNAILSLPVLTIAAPLPTIVPPVAPASTAAITAPPTSVPPMTMPQVTAAPGALGSNYLHMQYTFALRRPHLSRDGKGDLWVSSDQEGTKVRLRGLAHSSRFGDGEIILTADSKTRFLYASFNLKDMDKKQCVKYPFPSLEDNMIQVEKLQWRKNQVESWLSAGSSQTGIKMIQLRWSPKNNLEVHLDGTGGVDSIDLKRGARVLKTVTVSPGFEALAQMPPDAAHLFDEEPDCTLASDEDHPVAEVEFQMAYHKSSALKDLLLVMSMPGVPRFFTLLSAIAVPGDVAVMIENPEPPDFSKIGAVSFDYEANVTSMGNNHRSEGSIWVDPNNRTFRLRGEAKHTKIGPLYMDILAFGQTGQIFANVNLSAQDDHECVTYDFPVLNQDVVQTLRDLSVQKLEFLHVDNTEQDDYGIFVSPLNRNRWLYVWVDMEEEDHEAILKTEIHRNKKLLRSTRILRWRPNAEIAGALQLPATWQCSAHHKRSQLAHIGIHEVLGVNQMHKRSAELQDALFSLKNLSPNFLTLEVFALTGDVAIMVSEPRVPELWKIEKLSFNFRTQLTQQSATPASGEFVSISDAGLVQMSASIPGSVNLSVALQPGALSLHVVSASNVAGAKCIRLPVQYGASPPGNNPVALSGTFDGVEDIGGMECNHFTFLGPRAGEDDVAFWYCPEEDSVRQIQVLPQSKNQIQKAASATIRILSWDTDRQASNSELIAPASWQCRQATADEAAQPWASLGVGLQPNIMEPAAAALTELAEASGLMGLLPREAADVLTTMSSSHPPPLSVDMFGPELQFMSFSYASTFPLQGGQLQEGASMHRSSGNGEIRVNLAKRLMYMRSEARNVSAGIPHVESRVIFRGDRQMLYAMTRIESEGFERCWSIRTNDALPAPKGGVQPNPFQHAKPTGDGFSVPGSAGQLARRYVMFLANSKRLELFVNGGGLVAINMDDLQQDVSASILVSGWSTMEVDDAWFNPSQEWHCEALNVEEHAAHLANWDLMRVFFPVEDAAAMSNIGPQNPAGRRLFVV